MLQSEHCYSITNMNTVPRRIVKHGMHLQLVFNPEFYF